MKLVNVNQSILKRYYDADKTILCVQYVPYQNSTKIKVYFEGEPIGDVPEDSVSALLNKDNDVLFIKSEFNDDTGLIELVIETML